MKLHHPALLALLAAAFPSVPALATGAWNEQAVVSSAALYAVHAVDDQVAWAAGDGGQVFRTTNGGADWQPRPTPSGTHRTLYAFDAQTCVVSGSTGAIWRTSDGGGNWSLVYSAGTAINGIHFFDGQRGMAVGNPAGDRWVVVNTTDGGTTWHPSPSAPPGPGSGFAQSLSWIGDQIGVFGTSQPVIWRTTNGGQLWSQVSTQVQEIAALVLSPNGIGLAGGDPNALDRSTDAGETWEAVRSPTVDPLLRFDWVQGDEVWGMAADAGLFHSTDGGSGWESFTLGPAYVANDIDFATSTTGWSVGKHSGTGAGRIWKYSGNVTAVDVESSPGLLLIICAPNPFTDLVAFETQGGAAGGIEIKIYDPAGRLVASLARAESSSGRVRLTWDGKDTSGNPVRHGGYFWRADTEYGEVTGKLLRSSR